MGTPTNFAGIIPNFFGILSDSLSNISDIFKSVYLYLGEIIKSLSLFLWEWHELEPKKSMLFIGELGGHCHGPLWGPQPIPAGIIPNSFGILLDSASNFSEIIKSLSLFLREWYELEPKKSMIFIGELGGHCHGPLGDPNQFLLESSQTFLAYYQIV